MIQRERGNLLAAETEALVNTVNCVGIMGKGVALQFKQAFYDNFIQYERACKTGQVKPGHMFIVSTDSLVNPKYIINFPTKYHWKEKSKIEYVKTGLEALIENVKKLKIASIALPPLGCGNGGLEWSVVAPLIEEAFATVPEVQVLLFEPQDAPQGASMPINTAKPKMTPARARLICLMKQYRLLDLPYELTLREIQKLVYFLQEAGEELKLDYVKHTYGPYADKVNHVLQRMEGHYIRGYGDRSQRAEIHLLPGAIEEAQAFLNGNLVVREKLCRVGQLIEGFQDPYGMELLATVHWVVTRENLLAATEVEQAIIEVQAWSARKRAIFKPQHIRKAWQRLHDQGWFRSTGAKLSF